MKNINSYNIIKLIFFILSLLLFNCNKPLKNNYFFEKIEPSKNLNELYSVYDSLKNPLEFNTAIYFLTNMRHRFSKQNKGKHSTDILNNDFLKIHYKTLDFLLTHKKKIKGKPYHFIKHLIKKDSIAEIELTKKLKKNNFSNEEITLDYKNITSNYIKNHFKHAFKSKKESLFAKQINIKELKETFLPYRYDNELVDENSDNVLLKKNILNNENISLKQAIDNFNQYIYAFTCFSGDLSTESDLGFFNLMKWKKSSCLENTIWSTNVLNDIGIPTYIDFTAQWFNKSGMHYWCSSIDKKGNLNPFSPRWQAIGDSLYFKRTSKVYRKTFEVNKESPVFIKRIDSLIPIFNSLNFKDVTDLYHKCSNIKIPIDKIKKTDRTIYLSLITSSKLEPIGWGVIDKSESILKINKVPIKKIYTLSIMVDKILKPISDPFYVRENGNIIFLSTDKSTNKSLILKRKFPINDKIVERINHLKGAVFQGSNSPNFIHAENLFKIGDTLSPIMYDFKVKNPKAYRYVRLKPKKGKKCYSSIIEFYENSPEEVTKPYIFNYKDSVILNQASLIKKLSGELISKNLIEENFDNLKNAFDGNLLTYSKHEWVGMDFKTPRVIDRIRFAPVNSNNNINIGDTYELFYYERGWKKIESGVKKAKLNFLDYQSVPNSTIFLLRNLTRGVEEHPFIYHNNKQYFVNHDNMDLIFK